MELGSSPMEAWVLEAIPEDGRMCASELAEQLEVPTSTVTRALRRLESQGYVELTKGFFFDARVLRARVTGSGERLRRLVRDFEQEVDRVLLERARPPDVGGMLSVLLHISERRFQPQGPGEEPGA